MNGNLSAPTHLGQEKKIVLIHYSGRGFFLNAQMTCAAQSMTVGEMKHLRASYAAQRTSTAIHDAILHHEANVLHGADVQHRIAGNRNDVGEIAGF